MPFLIVSWNINSIRLREDLICRLMREFRPDIIGLQECKSPVENIPTKKFKKLGYRFILAAGQKSYNGVAILSKLRIQEVGRLDFANLEQARHVAGQLENGVTIHNVYVPAGGDVPDRVQNLKFDQKLNYLTHMTTWFKRHKPKRTILLGDLNIAPREDDVWSHKSLLGVVSHTPIEVEHLENLRSSGDWCDVTRQHIPAGKLYSWWSYRAKDWRAADRGRRLDHIWATSDIAPSVQSSCIMKDVRGWTKPSDHAPVFAHFDL